MATLPDDLRAFLARGDQLQFHSRNSQVGAIRLKSPCDCPVVFPVSLS